MGGREPARKILTEAGTDTLASLAGRTKTSGPYI